MVCSTGLSFDTSARDKNIWSDSSLISTTFRATGWHRVGPRSLNPPKWWSRHLAVPSNSTLFSGGCLFGRSKAFVLLVQKNRFGPFFGPFESWEYGYVEFSPCPRTCIPIPPSLHHHFRVLPYLTKESTTPLLASTFCWLLKTSPNPGTLSNPGTLCLRDHPPVITPLYSHIIVPV